MEALLLCLVVGITDGDTLKARCGDAPMATYRLAEIDAPEKRQPYGEKSRQNLAALCYQKVAEVHPKVRDRYGRTVARVTCGGQDASAAQARAGMAWAYTRYLTDPAVKGLEEAAREAGRGLWADRTPMAPWDWRRQVKGPRDAQPPSTAARHLT